MLPDTVRRNPALVFARVLGFGAALTTSVLWYWLLFDPASQGAITGGAYVVGAIMISLALLVVWGVFTLKPWTLLLAFVGSFVPIGLYTLRLPGSFRFVGVANLVYLFAAMLMIIAHKSTET
jgi:hypothetical protein